jgi:N-terminal domain of molybdenum-binding protein
MKSYLPKRFDFRVRVFMEEPDFGKGVAQLLSLTREKGSLSAAYKSMGMAASKAWKILNRAEADLGVKLVERKSGGKQGGGSHLTPEGEDILNRYENFQKEVAEAVKTFFYKKLWKFRRIIKYHEKKRIKTVITFETTTQAIGMESACKKHQIAGRLIPVPKEITAGCGMAWMTPFRK